MKESSPVCQIQINKMMTKRKLLLRLGKKQIKRETRERTSKLIKRLALGKKNRKLRHRLRISLMAKKSKLTIL
jgi:hypothetical protein